MISDAELLRAVDEATSEDFLVYGELGREGATKVALLALERATGSLVVLVVVASVADDGSTEICLRRGTCIEANPLIGRNPSTAKLAGFKLATAALNYALITEMAKRDPKAARIFGMVSVGVFGGVAAANLRFAF